MKLVIAFVHSRDLGQLLTDANCAGLTVVQIADCTTRLEERGAVVMIGVEDARLTFALNCIRRTCSRRFEPISAWLLEEVYGSYGSNPLTVEVGGATVLVAKAVHVEILE